MVLTKDDDGEIQGRSVTIGHLLDDRKIGIFRLMGKSASGVPGILDNGGTEEDNLIGVYRGGSKDYGTGAENIDYIIHERKKNKDTGVQFLLPYNTKGRWWGDNHIFQLDPKNNIELKTLDSSKSSNSGNNSNNNHLKIYLKF